MTSRLAGLTTIVTGASSGIGEGVAARFVAEGATVFAASRRPVTLDGVTWVETDVADAASCDALIAAAVDATGRLDTIVNNAGVQVEKPIEDTTDDDYDLVMNVNVRGVFNCCRAAVRQMATQSSGGSIINIGSILGEVGGGKLRVPGYAAAKGGLHNLTRELASQWGRKGVRVNAIAPGWFETEMNDAMFSDGGGQAYMESGAAMGRPGIEGELDGAMLYLASDASSFVTGHVLQVSGGWTAT